MAKLPGQGNWSQEQMRNAATIYQVGMRMGATPRDIQIALITALVESNLINVKYGDRDSLGLFQQRPSQGWGSPNQVMDPAYAATQFFNHLLGMGNKRYQMSMGAAAQAVQRSAYPDRYQQRIPEMRNLWPDIQTAAGDQPQSIDGGNYQNQNSIIPPPDLSNPYDALNKELSANQAVTPNVADMLGAWGLPTDPNSSTLPSDPTNALAAWGLPTADPSSGTGTFIGPSTNETFLKPLMQTQGPYQKGVDGWRKAVLDAARGAVGTPYVWGGNSLQNGVDCSGLVQQAFAAAGIDLPRVSYQQAVQGQRVGFNGLQPGDLIGWDNNPRQPGADHIAIYLGNGQIIEAPRPGLAVRIRNIGKNLEGGFGVHLTYGQN